MPPLQYRGTPAQWDVQPGSQNDLVTQSYISYLLSQSMAQTDITNQINTGLSSFATTAQAASLTSNLATPAWVATQEAGYIPASTIEQANGPVAVNPITGQVAQGLIGSTPSTQTFPQPFWSPSAYNTGTVTASTTPVQLYSMSFPYPGYPYVLLCAGTADCQVSADNGAYAEVFVNVGSPGSNNIIALGKSSAESYSGPAPGSIASEAFLSSAAGLSPSWGTLGTWSAQTGSINGVPLQSTVISNYLQVPTTMNGTVSVSANFGGAAGGTQTGLGGIYNPTPLTTVRIFRSDGTVVAQGGTVGGGGGTCTAVYSGPLTAGQLYSVQGVETGIGDGFFGVGAGHYGGWSSGTITIAANSVPMSSTANVIPVPFASQTRQTGPVTLYMMLASSDNTTPVTASTFDPGLWVMPIPW